ncbi:hypothetical protein G9A89_014333 [Geosiphon pyriformis]|nr:hypothetical protein G9A89_014333 [Geosiphon pyriformis]
MKTFSNFMCTLILIMVHMVTFVVLFEIKRESTIRENFREGISLNAGKRDFLNITKQQKKSKIVENPNLRKILVKDQELLGMLANNAYYARQAACLNHESERLWRLSFIGMPKSLKPTPGSYSQVILTFKFKERVYNNWKGHQSISIPYPNVKESLVDEYHFNIWLYCKEIFRAKIENLKSNSEFHVNKKYFTFTGFGRAGITAVYAALDFASEHAVKPTVVTFGQPKMGNMKFVEFVTTQITLYRVTYRDDFTPSVPTYGYDIDTKAIDYSQLSGEYWIPFQDQCECAPLFTKTSNLEPPIKFPSVYKCFEVGTLNVNPNCNEGRTKRRRKENRGMKKKDTDDHFGPYFGYMMGKCPSESVEKSSDMGIVTTHHVERHFYMNTPLN